MNYYTDKDIESNVSIKDCISLMQEAFVALSNKKANVPQRINMGMNEKNAQSLFMPVSSPDLDYYGVKNVTIHFNNPLKDLNLIHAHFILYDSEKGQLQAILDAEYITALRTGAASALASNLFSRNDSEVLGLIGIGKQAIMQVKSILEVRDIKKILLSCRTKAKIESFYNSLQLKKDLDFKIIDNKAEFREADIICTATSSKENVLFNENINDHVHINGIGSYNPEMAEIESKIFKRAAIIVDSYQSAMTEAGDLIQAIRKGDISKENCQNELGAFITRDTSHLKSQITIFKSVGNAIQDLYTACFFYRKIKSMV